MFAQTLFLSPMLPLSSGGSKFQKSGVSFLSRFLWKGVSQENEGRVWADGLGLASPGQGVCGGELRAFPPSYKLTAHGLGRLARQLGISL